MFGCKNLDSTNGASSTKRPTVGADTSEGLKEKQRKRGLSWLEESPEVVAEGGQSWVEGVLLTYSFLLVTVAGVAERQFGQDSARLITGVRSCPDSVPERVVQCGGVVEWEEILEHHQAALEEARAITRGHTEPPKHSELLRRVDAAH